MVSSGWVLIRGIHAIGNNKLDIGVDNWFLAIVFALIGTHILGDWKWVHKIHKINYV